MPRLGDGVLVGASDHLFYEMEMLRWTTETLARTKDLGTNPRNSILESFIIHLRLLIGFLYDSPTHDDDVTASDYFEGGVWTPKEISQALKVARERANKEIAHLTSFRVGKKLMEKEWAFIALGVEVFDLLQSFIDVVPPHRMEAQYAERFKNLRIRVISIEAVGHTSRRST